MISRSKTYILTTAFIVFLIFMSYMYNLTFIIDFTENIYYNAENMYITIPAIICSLIFLKQGAYWILITFCGIIDTCYLIYQTQTEITSENIYPIILVFITFIVISFVLNTVISFFRD